MTADAAPEPAPPPAPRPAPAARKAPPSPSPVPAPILDNDDDDDDDIAAAEPSATRPRKRRRKGRPVHDDATHMSIRVDSELRNYFHIACRLRNENASDVLRDYMRRYVDRHMKLPTD